MAGTREQGEAGEPEAGALAGPRGSWMSLQPGLPLPLGLGLRSPASPIIGQVQMFIQRASKNSAPQLSRASTVGLPLPSGSSQAQMGSPQGCQELLPQQQILPGSLPSQPRAPLSPAQGLHHLLPGPRPQPRHSASDPAPRQLPQVSQTLSQMCECGGWAVLTHTHAGTSQTIFPGSDSTFPSACCMPVSTGTGTQREACPRLPVAHLAKTDINHVRGADN